MKQKSVRLISVIFALCLIAFVIVLATSGSIITAQAKGNIEQSVEPQTVEFYVNDFAGVFSDSQKEELIVKAEKLHEETGGIQVVVTTIKTLNGTPIQDYAYDMYTQYEIGKDGMGVLILFATEDRDIMFATGDQMEIYITDSTCRKIIDQYGLEYFSVDQFDLALISIQQAVINQITSTVPTDWDKTKLNKDTASSTGNNVENDAPNETVNEEGNASKQWPFVAAFIAFIVSLIAAIKSWVSSHNFKKLYNEQKDQNLALQEQNKVALSRAENAYKDKMSQKKDMFDKQVTALKTDYREFIEELNSKNASLEQKLNEKTLRVSELSGNLSQFEETYQRIKLLHPDIEDELAEQLQRELQAEATELDAKLAEVITFPADKDRVSIFEEALGLLASARPGVSKYLKTDALTVHQLHEDSVKLLNEFKRAEQEKADRAAANGVAKKIDALSSKFFKGSYENYEEICDIHDEFYSLTTSQQSLVPNATTSVLEKLFKESKADYNLYQAAKKAEGEVNNIIGRISKADEDDRDKLARAMKIYKRLSNAEQLYFDADLLSKLKKLIKQADDDHEERKRKREKEVAERRRAQSSYNNHFSSGSSYHSGSSHHNSGYSGSRTSGGGAHRKV